MKTGDTCGCNRRQFISATAMLGGSMNLVACRSPVSETADQGMDSIQVVPVPIPQVSIRMRSPNSALFGITSDETIDITFAEVLKFHGYCGGGAAFAFRMAQEAFRVLYGDQLPIRQGIKVQTSHHCCQAAALAYITGARSDFGAFRSQGDLELIPEEEKKTVFIDKPSGSAVTLGMHFNPHDTFEPLFKKAMKSSEFSPLVHKALNDKINEYLTAPVENLFSVHRTKTGV